MRINKILASLILSTTLIQNLSAQTRIEGHLIIDTSIWAPVVYLSLVPDFEHMNTMAIEMIIDKTKVDNSGNFSFKTQYLPDEVKLYRIHISKRGDPPASLSIGGKDENHLFFIARRNLGILIRDTCSEDFLKNLIIDGPPLNKEFHEINQIASFVDSINIYDATGKADLIRNAIGEKLRLLADTCTNPLIALYAIYKSQYEKNYPVNQQYYSEFLRKWKDEKSTYFIAFRKRMPHEKRGYVWIYLTIGATLFSLGFFTRSIMIDEKKNNNITEDLTSQERKILLMIKDGKSNKEISDELSISLSTVKSHVYNIYSKLDIRSRKEVFNL